LCCGRSIAASGWCAVVFITIAFHFFFFFFFFFCLERIIGSLGDRAIVPATHYCQGLSLQLWTRFSSICN
jgi:hypothetical protein